MSGNKSMQSIVNAFVNAPDCPPALFREIVRTALYNKENANAVLALHPELECDQFFMYAVAGFTVDTLCDNFHEICCNDTEEEREAFRTDPCTMYTAEDAHDDQLAEYFQEVDVNKLCWEYDL